MTSAIDLFVGVNETAWNKHPVAPGPLACVAPVYGKKDTTRRENRVYIPPDCLVRQDSGAFSDPPTKRLTFDEAHRRQETHAEKYNYSDQLESTASYDLLIDEKWLNGERTKRRWGEAEAEAAVSETVSAAKFLSSHRNGCRLVLSAQGTTPEQYLTCVQRIAPFFRDDDVLGLGGWCIIGKQPKRMLPQFQHTIIKVIPFAAQSGIKHIHIWGVLYAQALGGLLWMCDQFGLTLATDSSGPSVRPTHGEYGYADWRIKDYKQPPVETRGLERARLVAEVRTWLANFRSTQYYKEPKPKPYQLQF